MFYGRDYFGRRSLLFHLDEQSLRLSSTNLESAEVPALGIFHVDLGEPTLKSALAPWSNDGPLTRPILSVSSCIGNGLCELIIGETIEHLKRSMCRRILSIPLIHDSTASRISILFSGGIDSVVMAIMADLVLPHSIPIDLINVAFQNDRFLSNNPQSNDYDVPDRISGLLAFEQLKSLTFRQWNFIKVNVPRHEYNAHRNHVLKIMRPNDTIMDLSIAIALWFAARGQGILCGPETHFQSMAKVILVGMGADEQLAGYGRHRTSYEVGGYSAVVQEVQAELNRISSRNLGRDDRCISDHGKEARFPFLDEELVNYLSSLPITTKCDLSLPKGYGEKALFRQITKKMGFSDKVAYLPKRAMQFGAKTAKIENNLSGKIHIKSLEE